MKNTEILLPAVFLCLSVAIATCAHAATITFQFEYSGGPYSNASATGSITFEDTLLPNPTSSLLSFSLSDPLIHAFSLTVSGATVGNGTFGIADLGIFSWGTGGGTLDLTTELVGQPIPGGVWGDPASMLGDFNFCDATPLSGAPVCINWYMLATNDDDDGDFLWLTSVKPVPIIPAVWLFGSGLLGLIGVARKKAA